MQKNIIGFITLTCLVVFSGASGLAVDSDMGTHSASGRLVQGYRIIALERSAEERNLVVFRGDYIKFDLQADFGDSILQIPDLSIHQDLSKGLDETPYFKMKTTGRFPFSLGSVVGNIHVIEYKQAHYREVNAREAVELLKNVNPLLLDVRTRAEFKRGHIKDALLLPVQELQKRVGELSAYKHSDILIYCATGNRSTVASKILVDNGFKRITNMRYGIVQWAHSKYPVTK